MEKVRSLADQIREELGKPQAKDTEISPKSNANSSKVRSGKKSTQELPDIIKAILAYDNSSNKKMVHVRFDQRTVDTLTKFKMATGTDLSKFVAFSVNHVMENFPEIKNTIKKFIQNTDL